MKLLKYIFLVSGIFLFSCCSDYLNVVPDGTATLDNAFSNRVNAERFFYSCYKMLPNFAHMFDYPGHTGGDEIWWDIDNNMTNNNGARIAQGFQDVTNPYQNYWDGERGGKKMWVGIRDCNIFLENIHKVPDMQETERVRWIAEIKFLKAYFHFFLLQLYGPIPIMDKNIEVSASPNEVRVYREPVDDVINYVVNLLDEATPDLPLYIENRMEETGRVTQPIALSVKAKALVWAASPLFNGSYVFYQDFKDKRGVQLVSDDNSGEAITERWKRAAVAIKNAIDTCHLSGHSLYEFQREFVAMSDTLALKYTLRGAATERMDRNREIIWGCMENNNQHQNWCTPLIYTNYAGTSELSATMKIAETYYTRNGIPIDEDPYWEYESRYEIRPDTGVWHRDYIGAGETTAKLNFYREPRFYAHLGFDRGYYEILSPEGGNDLMIKNKSGDTHGLRYQDCHISTGYFIKKAVNFRTAIANSPSPNPTRFSVPIIRLADLYLLYAEALNESQEAPDSEVYKWIDIVRERAGLDGVVESWRFAAPEFQSKPQTKEGMREIIKRERLIELSCEGQRSFDLRRWRDAEKYFNEPVRGWDFQGVKIEDYYQTRVYFSNRKFTYKDYLWPLKNNTIIVNSNLVQNPGW